MRNKSKGVIYTVVLLVVVCVCIYFVYIKPDDKSEVDDKMTLSDEEMSQLDDTQISEQDKLLAERESYRALCKEIALGSKDYREGVYGQTFNKDFVKEECIFRSINDMVEYEFLDYEEINSLAEYMEQANKDIESGKTSEIHYSFEDFIARGYLGEDGRLIPQNRIVYKKDSNTGEFGEQIIDEESELVGIKIRVRYKNLSVKENEVWYDKLHRLYSYIYAEDNELYHISSVYRRNVILEANSRVYTTMAERYVITNGSLTGIEAMHNCIKLEPLEEYIGEIIYLVPKAELDNIAFTSSYAVNGDTLNYKDIGTNIVFASYLKEKFAK